VSREPLGDEHPTGEDKDYVRQADTRYANARDRLQGRKSDWMGERETRRGQGQTGSFGRRRCLVNIGRW
jgi:hypothetical protein